MIRMSLCSVPFFNMPLFWKCWSNTAQITSIDVVSKKTASNGAEINTLVIQLFSVYRRQFCEYRNLPSCMEIIHVYTRMYCMSQDNMDNTKY